MSAADCYRGTIVPGREPGQFRTVPLSWIYSCPSCEYRHTAATEEAIVVCRDTHNRTVHPDKVLGVLWADSPLSVLG